MESNIDETLAKVHSDIIRTRVRFPVKIFHVLRLTAQEKSAIPKAGIAWCQNGHEFICNSRILGHFIGLKSNSVNTNFRDHGFKIVDQAVNELFECFGSLPDITNWRKRVHTSFNSKTTLEEAENIHCIPKTGTLELECTVLPKPIPVQHPLAIERKLPISDSLIPPKTYSLIREDEECLISTALIASKMSIPTQSRINILQKVTDQWISYFGEVSSTPVSKLISSLICQNSLPFAANPSTLRANLEFLLHKEAMKSQQSMNVPFFEYFALMLRYGPHEKLAQILSSLTDQPHMNSLQSLLNLSQSSQCDSMVSFLSWFHPELDCISAETLLQGHNEESWLVRHCSSSDAFAVHMKMNADGVIRFASTKLIVSAYDEDPSKRVTISIGENSILTFPSINDAVFQGLNLKIGPSIGPLESPPRVKTANVDAGVIIRKELPPFELFCSNSLLNFTFSNSM